MSFCSSSPLCWQRSLELTFHFEAQGIARYGKIRYTSSANGRIIPAHLWTPLNAGSRKLPALVWIHGGAQPPHLMLGHDVRVSGTSRSQGRTMGIMVDPETGLLKRAADPRAADGAAVGYWEGEKVDRA